MVRNLFDAIGEPELGNDERFATRNARVHHDQELTTLIEAWAAGYTADEVVARLAAASIAVAPVREPRLAVQDERVTARNETVPVTHPTLGAIPNLMTAGIPLVLSESQVGFKRPAPRLGEHTIEVLGALGGYDDERLQYLHDAGVTSSAVGLTADSPLSAPTPETA
jgi:CoA:oxalate CoA-transferase